MLAIGGVGGSGTRVVAGFLQQMGFYLGSDLNEANDNLWFTLLFKRPEILHASDQEFNQLVQIFSNAMHSVPISTADQAALIRSLPADGRAQHPADWLQERAKSILGIAPAPANRLLAWKEPNTHIVLDRLASDMPGLRYIHVMRNGMDMAFSGNQNQTRLWGPAITGKPFEPSPSYALHYWCKAHERVMQIGRRMGGCFHLITLEDLCSHPAKAIAKIAEFAGLATDDDKIRTLCETVKPPPSIGRCRGQGLEAFDQNDVAFVASCGFPSS